MSSKSLPRGKLNFLPYRLLIFNPAFSIQTLNTSEGLHSTLLIRHSTEDIDRALNGTAAVPDSIVIHLRCFDPLVALYIIQIYTAEPSAIICLESATNEDVLILEVNHAELAPIRDRCRQFCATNITLQKARVVK